MDEKNADRTLPAPEIDPSETWHSLFLSTLGASGNVAAACRAAQVARRTAYDQKERDEDFSAAWEMMREFAVDNVEGRLFEVAGDGNVQAMQLVLKAYRHIYRDNQQPVVQVNTYTTIEGVPAVQALKARIDQVTARQAAHDRVALPEPEDTDD